jgi:hypothetical protein
MFWFRPEPDPNENQEPEPEIDEFNLLEYLKNANLVYNYLNLNLKIPTFKNDFKIFFKGRSLQSRNR